MQNLRRADRKGGHTKAPPNGFILFRSDYKSIPDNQVTADGRRKKETEITKDAAAAWKGLPQVVRDDYLGRARNSLAEHKREHRDYWSQRRGQDGRFMCMSGSNNAVSNHGGEQTDNAANSRPPLIQPLPSLGSFYRPIGSFSVDLDPSYRSVAATSSDGVQSFLPVSIIPAVNAPTQALPFSLLPGTSSSESQSFPAHVPSSFDVTMSAPATALPYYEHVPSLHTAIHYPTPVNATYQNGDRGRGGFLDQNTVSLQPPLQPATHDFSSRTLTLSSSAWEMVDLFLSMSTPSGSTTPTTIPHRQLSRQQHGS